MAPEELREEKQMGGAVNCSDSELCTYLQALAEGYLVTYYSGTNQSAPSKSITIASKSWRHGKKTGVFPGSQFLMTLQNSRGIGGGDSLMLSLAVSPVRTSVPQVLALELMESAADYGPKWYGSLAKYDPASSSWKTAQFSLLGGLDEFSETWPRWGMTHNGDAYLLEVSVPTMNEIASGSLLPTPTCHNAKEGAYPAEYTRNTPTLATHVGGKIHPNFTEWMMGWPMDWTDLKPLETDKFQAWLSAHSGH